jgi:hypothetical protein
MFPAIGQRLGRCLSPRLQAERGVEGVTETRFVAENELCETFGDGLILNQGSLLE